MIKPVSAAAAALMALAILLWLCWIAAADAQGAIALFLFAPGVLGLSAISYWLSRGSTIRRVTSPFTGLVLLFYATLLIPSKYSPAQFLLVTVAATFERATGFTPYAWIHRHSKT